MTTATQPTTNGEAPKATATMADKTPVPAELIAALGVRLTDPRVELAILKERIAVAQYLREHGHRDCKDVIGNVLDAEHHRTPDEAKRAAAIDDLVTAANAACWSLAKEVAAAYGITFDAAKTYPCAQRLREALTAYEAVK